MLVKRKSILDGKTYSMELPVTEDQLNVYATGLHYVQDVFPELDAGQREFIRAGILPENWNEMFGEEST